MKDVNAKYLLRAPEKDMGLWRTLAIKRNMHFSDWLREAADHFATAHPDGLKHAGEIIELPSADDRKAAQTAPKKKEPKNALKAAVEERERQRELEEKYPALAQVQKSKGRTVR